MGQVGEDGRQVQGAQLLAEVTTPLAHDLRQATQLQATIIHMFPQSNMKNGLGLYAYRLVAV